MSYEFISCNISKLLVFSIRTTSVMYDVACLFLSLFAGGQALVLCEAPSGGFDCKRCYLEKAGCVEGPTVSLV